MSPPWQPTTAKTVTEIDQKTQALPSGRLKPLFALPACPQPLTFSGLTLFAGMGRSIATITALSQTHQTMIAMAKNMISVLVDDDPVEFWLTQEIENIGDSRPFFSGELGAGLAHVVMGKLNCDYSTHGRAIIPRGPAPDFIFTAPKSYRQALIPVEAKANVSKSMTPKSLLAQVQDGYDRQVEPFIGTWLDGTIVPHGYAIGFGCRPGRDDTSRLQIIEPQGVTVMVAGSPKDQGDAAANPVTPFANTILGNYRSVLSLLGRTDVVQVIDLVRFGLASRDLVRPLLSLPPENLALSLGPLEDRGVEVQFSLDEKVFLAFAGQLAEFIGNERREFELPTLEPRGFEGGPSVQFADGFKVNIVEADLFGPRRRRSTPFGTEVRIREAFAAPEAYMLKAGG